MFKRQSEEVEETHAKRQKVDREVNKAQVETPVESARQLQQALIFQQESSPRLRKGKSDILSLFTILTASRYQDT